MLQWLSRLFAKPLIRSPLRQHQVNEETRHLTLYYFPLCPYCHKVDRVIRQLNLNIERRDAARSTSWGDELRRGGGKIQVPCLRIKQRAKSEWLYESEEIIRFLREQFATMEDVSSEYNG
jgi:glutathione S-transferase